MLSIFSHAYWLSVCPLWRNAIKVLCPFLIGLFFVELYGCLDVLELKHLHHTFPTYPPKFLFPVNCFPASPFHLYIFLNLSLLSGVVRLCLQWVCPAQQNKDQAEAIRLVLECSSLERGWGSLSPSCHA